MENIIYNKIKSRNRRLFLFLYGVSFKSMMAKTGMFLVLVLFSNVHVNGQEDFNIPYVPTPSSVVQKMLDIANVGPGDYLIDLGSGDGRIVIDAAKRGAVGHGVEIDSELVRKAEENARNAHVDDKVMFLEEDVFNTDFSRASVVTLYLMNFINMELRPLLIEKLNPGTRIVSHSFDMKDWKPDKHVEESGHQIYYWMVPAEIEGEWQWEVNGKQFSMSAEQKFQEIQLEIRLEGDSLEVREQVLKGRRLNFTAVHPDRNIKYICHGKVKARKITGKLQIIGNNTETVKNWTATAIKSKQQTSSILD